MKRRARIDATRLLWQLGQESQEVIAARLARLGSGTAGSEAVRMVAEKPIGLAEAAFDAAAAAAGGLWRHPFDPIGAAADATQAWTQSLLHKVRANRRRLRKKT